MATYILADIERIETGYADVGSTMRIKQTAFENDGDFKMVHKYEDGTYKYWYNSDYVDAKYASSAHNHHTLVSEGENINPVVYVDPNGNVSIANVSGVTPSNQLHVIHDDEVNNDIVYVARFDHTTSAGTISAGIGTGILLGTEVNTYGDIGLGGIVVKPTDISSNLHGQMELRVQGSTGLLSRMSIDESKIQNEVPLKFSTGATVSTFSTDGTLSANSDSIVPTEKAIKTYVGNYVATSAASIGSITQWSGVVSATSGAPVYTNNNCYYHKIGNMVFYSISFTEDGGSEGVGTQILYINMPTDINTNWTQCGNGFYINGSDTDLGITAVRNGTNTITLRKHSDSAYMKGADQNSTTRAIYLSGQYEAA